MKNTLLALGISATLLANPKEAIVMAGSASFSEPAPGILEIATSDLAIINWTDFSIELDETTRFIQPGELSAVLNRVTGGNLSDLQGKLLANGTVYLLNPNGVFISPNAIIQTNNLVTTTFEISDADFLSHDFSKGLFYVPPAVKEHDHPFAAAIRHEGQISALSVEKRGGRFYLLADRVEVSGTIDSPSGHVRIVADQILLSDGAKIDVSGEGGGVIEIGGGAHGKDALIPNASQVGVTSGAALFANATSYGDGGTIVVWSQDGTWFHGSAEARGGVEGGNGGFVEVSGKNYLDYQGFTVTTAPKGNVGTLLLDPINITVIGGMTNSNITAAPIFRPTASPSTITFGTITGALMSSAVIVESSGADGFENGDVIISVGFSYNQPYDLTFRTANLSTTPAVPSGNIYINSSVTNMGTGSIIFDASGSIFQSAADTSTGGSITYIAQDDLNLTAGAADARVTLTAGAGVITVQVGRNCIVTGAGPTDAGFDATFPAAGRIIADIGGDLYLIPNSPGGGASFGAENGLTMNIGGNLFMDQAGDGAGCSITLSTGAMVIDVGGNAFLNGSALIDGFSNPGSSIINIGGDLTMLDSANMAQNLDGGFTLNVGGNMTMSGFFPYISVGATSAGNLSIFVGGNFLANGDGDIDASGLTGAFLMDVVGNIQLMDSFNFASFGSDRLMDIRAGGSFIITGTTGEDAGFSLNNDGPTVIRVGGDFVMQGAALYDNSDNGSLTITAGNSLGFFDTSRVIFTGPTSVTLTCDAQFPKPPGIGTGQFLKHHDAVINTNGGPFLIYTAVRSQNFIYGLLNGVPFVTGPEFINSATEMWGIYSPHNSGFPYTIFYKNIFIPIPVLDAFNIAYYEFLQNLSKFDRLFFRVKEFDAIGNNTMIQPLYWQMNPIWFAPSFYLE